VLVDDRERARRPWEAAGGVFVLWRPAHPEQSLREVADAIGMPARGALAGGSSAAAAEPPTLSGGVARGAAGRGGGAKAAAKVAARAEKAAAKAAKAAHRRAPKLMLLAGLPGSGKSTFGASLEACGAYVRVCQDEEGSRSACEALVARHAQRGQRVLVDRCNVTVRERAAWLACAFAPQSAAVVFFDVGASECASRVAGRADHPTVRQGTGSHVVMSFAKQLEPPTTVEGFSEVFTVRTFAEADALLVKLGARPGARSESEKCEV